MYHYLKWAAFSLFLKRNLRYLVFILISLVGIYGIDGIYRDLADYALAMDRKGWILYFLIGKWTVVIALSILLVYSVMHLGVSRESSAEKRRSAAEKERIKAQEDAVMERLEKFRNKGRLRRKSDLVLERLEREKKRK